MAIGTGARARLAFGYESSFGAGGSANLTFGQGQRLTGITGRTGVDRIYNIGYREARKLVALRFEGTWGVEAILSNNGILKAIFGTEEGVDTDSDGVVDQYEYTVAKVPVSIVIEAGFEGDKNVLRTLKGCVVRRAAITTRVNEMVRLRIDGMYATEVLSNPASIDIVEDTNEPFTFVGGTLEFPSGTTRAKIQAIDVDIGTGNELVYAVGSRTAVDAFARRFEVRGRFSAIAEDDEYIRYMLGLGDTTASEPANESAVTEQTMKLTLSNGKESAVFEFTGVAIEDIGSAIEANEMIMFDVRFVARDLKVTWIV